MAALTKDKNVERRHTQRVIALKVKTNTVIYQGALVAVDATGFAVPAADAANQKVVGIALENVNNNPGADGAKTVKVQKGQFKVVNNGTNPIVQATVGGNALVVDDQTVRASGAANSIVAGVVDEIDADGVWINIA